MDSMSRRTMLRTTGVSIAGLALGLAGCGGGGEGGDSVPELRMTWWGDPTRQKLMRQAIDLYTKRHPGTKITREAAPWNGYWEKLATQVAGRSAADWIMMDQSYLGEYAQRHALADLSGLVGGKLDVSALPKPLVDAALIDGKLYVVPLALNSQVLLYDETALGHVGVNMPTGDISWDAFATFAGDVAKASKGKLAGTADMGFDTATLEVWLRGQGKELYADDGRSLAVTEDDLTHWWTYWLELQKSGAAVSAAAQAASNAGTAADDVMVKKHAAATFNWTPAWQSLEALTPAHIGARMLPVGTGGSGQFVKPACYFCSPASSKRVELAAELTTFLLNDAGAAKALGLILGVPVSSKTQDAVAASAEGSGKRTVEYVAEVQRTAPPQRRPWPKGAGAVTDTLKRTHEDLSFGRTKLADAVKRMVDDGNRALQQ